MKRIIILAVVLLGTDYLSAQLATVTVPSGPVVRVPSGFLGLAHETTSPGVLYGSDKVMGQASTGVDTIYRRLVTNLAEYGGGPFQIRIGGGGTQNIHTAMNVQPYAELYAYDGAQFVLDVNAKTATISEAQTMTAAYYAAMPSGSVLAYEVGNEPDLLYTNPTTGFATYTAILGQWITGLQSVTSSSQAFAGPSCAAYNCLANWSQAGIMAQNRGALRYYNSHYYVTYDGTPDTDRWLQAYSYTQPAAMAQEVSAAHHLGMKYTVNEFNTNACADTIPSPASPHCAPALTGSCTSGSPDVRCNSLQFQAALWGLKSLFDLAATGVDTVYIFGNLAACGTSFCNNPVNMAEIVIHNGTPNTFTLSGIYGLYYGALAFQRATANQPTLRVASVTAGTSSTVSAYDTVDPAGTERMTLVNLDETHSGNVLVTPKGTHTSASVCYLSAPSYSSLSGMTLCEQTFDGSTDGTIQGVANRPTVTPTAGVYTVSLAATQAAIITFN